MCLRGNRKSNFIFYFAAATATRARARGAREKRFRARPFISLNARVKLMARDIRIFACEIATIFLSGPSLAYINGPARRAQSAPNRDLIQTDYLHSN